MTIGSWAYIDSATYWSAPTQTGYGGVEFGTPRLISTKWEDSVVEFTDAHGVTTQSKSIVYVMEELEEGGYLILGNFVTTPTNDPTTLNDAFYIKRVDRTRDLRGLNMEIKVYL